MLSAKCSRDDCGEGENSHSATENDESTTARRTLGYTRPLAKCFSKTASPAITPEVSTQSACSDLNPSPGLPGKSIVCEPSIRENKARKKLIFNYSAKNDKGNHRQHLKRKAVQQLKSDVSDNDSEESDSLRDFDGSDFDDPTWGDDNRSTKESSSSDSEKRKKDSVGEYQDEVRQTLQCKRKTGPESRAPSPDFFGPEDDGAESNQLFFHSTPKSSRLSLGKKKKPQRAAVSENRTINCSSNKPMQITTLTDSNQLSSCSTPKSSQAENKNNSGVSVENLSPRPIRKTRLKPPTRLSSPDIFASEEENWESEDTLRLESPSSSSSSSLTSKTPTRRKRKLEVAEMIDDSDEERNLVPQKKIRKKKSTSYLSKEEKSMRQHLRNSGQAYVTYYSNKEIGPRKRKQPHVCTRNYCHVTITDDIGESLFTEYWEQASYEKRVAYVAARLKACPIKSRRPRLPPGHKKAHPKSVMWNYYFHIHGEVKQVCKSTFLGTLGETDGFVKFVVINKKRKLSGVTRDGQRGKKSAKHKLTDEKINGVTQHVLKFPSYKSHYKRAEVGDRRYLPSHLNIKQMHQMYLNEGGNVSYSTYQRIFNTLGRSFRKPPTDTCAKCDAWQQKLEHAPDQVTKEEVQKEWNVHLDRAQAAYDFKRNCKVQAETDETLRVLIFDLEQVLETPLLSAGETFYLRQLSTYNLTIYDTTSKLTLCYMWCELDGNRGANDIASCIFVHFLEEIPDTVKKVVLFSDSTVSQNRNSIVAAMFLTVLQMHCSVRSIEHVFLEAGHTRLEVDSKHSVIDCNKNNVDKICVPSDWYELVRSIGSSNKEFPNGRFKVVEMKGEFYDFQSLLKGPLVKRTITTTKDKFNWLTTPLLRYDVNKPGKVFFKGSLGDNGYGCLDFQRRGKAGEYSAKNLQASLKPIYQEPLPVSTQKKKDLMKLLKLLPPRCHDFYKSISSSDAITDDKDDEDSSSSESE
ncbi:hypothetical protein FOCC_FOCC013956 [Frankliniella occidentalis]|nr:hypothetical protein FOCC_FOCC013956 [Frankliniella occidentalis]